MSRFVTFLLLIGLFTGYSVKAQELTFGPRHEIVQGVENNAYMVIPNGSEGALVVWTDYDPQNAVAILSMEFLDADLISIWNKNIEMPNRYLLKGYRYLDKKNYLLLESTTLDEVKVIRIDAATGETERFRSTEIEEFIITKFEVLQNTAVIGGYIGDRPAVFSYDFNKNRLTALPKVYQNNSMLVEVKVNNDGKTFNVLTTTNTENKDQTLLVNTYRHNGTPLRSYRIKTDPSYNLINGASSSFDENGQMVVGLYGYNGRHPVGGIYVSKVDNTGLQEITYHNFSELPQFLNFMGERGARKQRAKAAKFKAEGKEYLYRLAAMPNQLVEQGNQLVYTGEFFRSSNQAFDRNTKLYSALPNPNLNDMYGHYGYLNLPGDVAIPDIMHHAYTLVINKDGSIAWDDYLKLNIRNRSKAAGGSYMDLDVETIRNPGFLRAIGNFHWQDGNGHYLYYRDKNLYMKPLGTEGVTEKMTFPLKLNAANEKIVFDKNASFGTLSWYDNHILVYGIQHVKNTSQSSPPRRVFFLNKVAIGTEESSEQPD